MTTDGSWAAQRKAVAEVASVLFGSAVPEGNVIGETLERATNGEINMTSLSERVRSGKPPPEDVEGFRADPLSVWLEYTLGVTWAADDPSRLMRQRPRTIGGDDGVAGMLARLTGVTQDESAAAVQRQLLVGNDLLDESGSPIFAFKLHQFGPGATRCGLPSRPGTPAT